MDVLDSLYAALPFKVHVLPIPEPASVVLPVAGLVIGLWHMNPILTLPFYEVSLVKLPLWG